MNISRILPFLPLLMLLPAVSGIPLSVFPQQQPHMNPSELCPLVQIVEHELCANHTHTAAFESASLHDLCVLLQVYNASFCSNSAHHSEPMSNAGLSVRTLENEFLSARVKGICPILHFMDQALCATRTHERLCHLLTVARTERNCAAVH
jgi:hypothetical protein